MKRKNYSKEFIEKIIKLNLEEGRTQKSLNLEYGLGEGTIKNWLNKYREECKTNPLKQKEYDESKEILKLKKQIMELEKENSFLKKAAAFFAKEID